MASKDDQVHYECMQRFVKLANEMTEEGVPTHVAGASLMTASCVYSSFQVKGNRGRLSAEDIERVTTTYRQHLELVQGHREKAENEG
ncbi:MAG: DUF3144 domain-containing protein [Pseudomonadota bacterium]